MALDSEPKSRSRLTGHAKRFHREEAKSAKKNAKDKRI
jgi:hypothetical protein